MANYQLLGLNCCRSLDAVHNIFRNRWQCFHTTPLCAQAIAKNFNYSVVPNFGKRPSPESDADRLPVQSNQAQAVVKISRAMKAYLDRAHSHKQFMQKQEEDYDLGRRHLANMMGRQTDEFSQKEVDAAIKYLLPSALKDPDSHPFMRPPVEVFAAQKEAQFDFDGRPYHTLFYTNRPNMFNVMHEIQTKTNLLNDYEDARLYQNLRETDGELDLTGTRWLSYEEMQGKLIEKLSQQNYDRLIASLERLIRHGYAYKCQDFIMDFRVGLSAASAMFRPPPVMLDENGRRFVEFYENRKSAHCWLKLYDDGSGKWNINGSMNDQRDILYFERQQHREQILFPLQVVGRIFNYDFDVTLKLGGPSGQAGALRLCLATALTSFVSQEDMEKLRIAGLLTKDVRVRERKKPGREGARRGWNWCKR